MRGVQVTKQAGLSRAVSGAGRTYGSGSAQGGGRLWGKGGGVDTGLGTVSKVRKGSYGRRKVVKDWAVHVAVSRL